MVLGVQPGDDLRSVLLGAGLELGRPTLVCIGGADGMTAEVESEVADLLRRYVLPALDEWEAVVVDGGTDSGLMRSIGLAHDMSGAHLSLVGVAARGTVFGDGSSGAGHGATLEPHHTHILLVPGDKWGDESPWLSAVAAAIAGDAPSATMLVNGGAITVDDAERSLTAERPLLVLAGSGRAADDIAGGAPTSGRTQRIADHDRTEVVHLSDGPAVVRALASLLAR